MQTEKKVVYYRGEAMPYSYTPNDLRAVLVPVNHTNHVEGQEATNGFINTTSKVVNWNKETGVIETTYSIYVPYVEEIEKTEGVV